jgi:uncharacterized protein
VPSQAKAVLEAAAVFSLTLLLITVVSLSPIGAWERTLTNRPFIEYALMIVVPLGLLGLSHKSPHRFGITLSNLKYHLDIAATALVPVAIAAILRAFLNYRQWHGALLLGVIQAGLLFVLARILKGKPTRSDSGVMAGVALIWLAGDPVSMAAAAPAVSTFVFYLFFVGVGEELLFRGYIQSRLNHSFGRPYRFYGVPWGAGAVIAAALFGLMHVLNLGSVLTGAWEPAWWWGVWTFISGLVYALVREKTGSIVAPAVLHGLPQAIAYSIMG